MGKDDLFLQLEESRLLLTEQDVEQFENAIDSILESKNVTDIQYLCRGFDDKTDSDDVMFGLIHAIESYDGEIGSEMSLRAFVESIPVMLPHAWEWLKIMHMRILNYEQSRVVYKNIIHTIDGNIKNVIVSQFVEIKNEDSARFTSNIDFVLSVSM